VFWWRNLKERGYLEDPGIDGKIILNWIFKKCDGSMDWIDLAQNRDRWRAFVDAGRNLPVPKKVNNLLTSVKRVNFSRRTLFHGGSLVS
jgi:hypothetical protein